jgi:hypothetical protein
MYITGCTQKTECQEETIPWPKSVSTLSSVCLILNPGVIKLFCPRSAVARVGNRRIKGIGKE